MNILIRKYKTIVFIVYFEMKINTNIFFLIFVYNECRIEYCFFFFIHAHVLTKNFNKCNELCFVIQYHFQLKFVNFDKNECNFFN